MVSEGYWIEVAVDLKILILANDGAGLYNFRRELLEALVQRGDKVVVSLPRNHFVPKLVAMGCTFVETAVDRRGTNPVRDVSLLAAYLRVIRRHQPDLVLAYTVKPNVYGGLACRITRTPYISNITGIGTALVAGGPLRRLVLSLYRTGLKGSSCVFFQNNANRDLFVSERIIALEKTHIIPGSGVNLERHRYEEYPVEQEPIAFLYVGRIMREKGIEELLVASAHVKARHPHVAFHLVGECEEGHQSRLEALTRDGTIQYHGYSDDVPGFIRQTHATILPSYHEGTSNVLLESAAAGRPVLASNIPGCRETFDEGISGLGFAAREVAGLENAILDFIELPYERKRQMGLAGRRKMEREFDRRIVIRSYLTEIDRITGTEREVAYESR